jgi:hypothetical protein
MIAPNTTIYSTENLITIVSAPKLSEIPVIDWFSSEHCAKKAPWLSDPAPTYTTIKVLDGEQVSTCSGRCYEYGQDGFLNAITPCHFVFTTMAYREQVAREMFPPKALPKVEEEEKVDPLIELNEFAVKIVDFLKEQQQNLRSIRVNVNAKKNSETDVYSLKFNGDCDEYHLPGISESIPSLLQRTVEKFKPSPPKQQKLAELRNTRDDFELRRKRMTMEIPLNAQKLQKLQQRLQAERELLSDGVQLRELEATIQIQQTKLSKLEKEVQLISAQIIELSAKIVERMAPTQKSSPQLPLHPNYVMALRALRIMNKQDYTSHKFIQFMRTHAESFQEVTEFQKFINTIGDDLHFGPTPKPAPVAETTAKPAPVAETTAKPAPVAETMAKPAPVAETRPKAFVPEKKKKVSSRLERLGIKK